MGYPLALVVADTQQQAADAARAVQVKYEVSLIALSRLILLPLLYSRVMCSSLALPAPVTCSLSTFRFLEIPLLPRLLALASRLCLGSHLSRSPHHFRGKDVRFLYVVFYFIAPHPLLLHPGAPSHNHDRGCDCKGQLLPDRA